MKHFTVKFVMEDNDEDAFEKLKDNVFDSMRKDVGYNGVYVEMISTIDINQQIEDIQKVVKNGEFASEQMESIIDILNSNYTK